MRLPAEFPRVRIAVRIAVALGIWALGTIAHAREASPVGMSANGPQADYPVITGEPYSIGETTYTPVDVMNYDAVGIATVDAGAAGVTGSHHTLPLPSYVEVTSLETGRTILVRLERRGPMASNELVALSEGAMAQLEANGGSPVRVRRVNPPEIERVLLRSGERAPVRMNTPMPLVEVLRRKLPGATSPQPVAEPAAAPALAGPSQPDPVIDSPERLAAVAVEPEARPTANEPVGELAKVGHFMVQAASFSTAERADNAATSLGGSVTPSGKFYRVRTGPFATRGEAEASLAKVKAAGYTDARIYTSG